MLLRPRLAIVLADVTMNKANRTSLTYSNLTVTPQVASEILAEAVAFQNRAVKRWRVDSYAADMLAGRWRSNGEVIVFDSDGVLIDGQHRLQAVVKSGVTVEMTACYGVERDDAATIDQGCSRTMRDALTMDGARNVASVMAAARALHTLRGNVDPECATGKRHDKNACLTTAGGMEQFLLANEGLQDAWAMIPADAGRVMASTTLAAMLYEMSMVETAQDALAFIGGISGEGLTKRDIRVVLRDRVLDDRLAIARGSGRSRAVARSKVQQLALLVMAWNIWLTGTPATPKSLQLVERSNPIPVPLTRAQATAWGGPQGYSRGSLAEWRVRASR